MTAAAALAFDRAGEGSPLVLLHGLGDDRRTWHRVTPHLTGHHDVLTVDLAGHGTSPRVPRSAPSDPAALAATVAGLLDQLGLADAHLAGNSLGGWVALELALLGRARTVTGLCPAGLWRHESLRNRIAIHAGRVLVAFGPLPRLAMATTAGRRAGLRAVAASPDAVPVHDAQRVVSALAATRGFHRTARAAHATRFLGGRAIDVPVTIAWGDSDALLTPARAQRADELPEHTRWVTLPGCGHVPMLDNPAQCAATILATTIESP